ncbi:MAG: biotin carboxylase N-terminal domain-containing protein [Myxococcota bacterium]|nr:biotin carboxylase N-terminal domain-containing protein [Myxococcota bacterium]
MKRVLVANRGEIAVRIARSCQALGIETVAVVSDADRDALHARVATHVEHIGPAEASKSYLDAEALLAATRRSGADAVHPGYGFLSENAAFARSVVDAGLAWIGPPPEAIEAMGSKIAARSAMEAAGVPVVPGADAPSEPAALSASAAGLGYPILVKASAGGGGKGMRAVHDPASLADAVESARREAGSAFADDTVYLEKLLIKPRHVEVQIFGDAHGNVVHLMERECSIQRRHQKVLEECPSPALAPELRAQMGAAAVAAGQAVDYVGAGTVEFMLTEDGDFYFLEMNTRLQVEHPVTEEVLGVDLVAAQLAVASGRPMPWTQEELRPRGHAIEVRLYAEDPSQGFLPATGHLVRYRVPVGPGVRHDGGVDEGCEISHHYDPMLAKLIVYGASRTEAIGRLRAALDTWIVHGVVTNLPFLQALARHPAFEAGETHTGFIDEHFPDGLPLDDLPEDAALVALALSSLLGPSGGASPAAPTEGSGDRFSPWLGLAGWRGTR